MSRRINVRQPAGSPPAAPSTEAPDGVLSAYPALAALLGPEGFGALREAAIARAASRGTEPVAVVHSLLVASQLPRPAGVSRRLAADVAALEAAIHEVGLRAPLEAGAPRVVEEQLAALPRRDWRRAVLLPIRALRLVPVGHRLDAWLRRARSGRPGAAPRRHENEIAVYPLPGWRAAADPVWWLALDPPEAKLLGELALGTPLGEAVDESLARGELGDSEQVRRLLVSWLREGLFARLSAS